MPNVGRDTGILTSEEVKYVEERVIEAVHEHLIGRDLFPIVRMADAGWKFYKYYEMLDMSQAAISMEGVAQSDDIPLFPYGEVDLPVIDKTFMIQWRDILASRHQGPSLLEQAPRNAARQVAEEEDKLLISGEYTGWPALGIVGLRGSAGSTVPQSGNWPANAITDINLARTALQNAGFIGEEPVMIGQPAAIKCLDRQLTNTDITYRKFLLNNGLVRAIYETRNLFSAGGLTNSVLLVVPGRDNFYAVEAQPPEVHWWYDKAGNAYGTVREVIAPVIPRGEAIYQITGVTCT